jgi:hypothetical protein
MPFPALAIQNARLFREPGNLSPSEGCVSDANLLKIQGCVYRSPIIHNI